MSKNARTNEHNLESLELMTTEKLRFSAYQEIMELAYRFKPRSANDQTGDDEKLQLYFYPSYNAIGVSLYTTHRDDNGDYHIHTIKEEEINFDNDIVDLDSYNTVMGRVIPWLSAACLNAGGRRIS